MRSNQSEKNVDKGGFVGVVISSTTTRPPGAPRAPSRAARARGRRSCARRSRRWRRRTRRPGTGSASALACSQSSSGAFVRARSSIPSEKSEPTTSPPARPARSSIARSPVPVATSSARVARADAREVGRPLAPAVVQPGRHDRVHEVVDAGDAIEHRADLTLLERCRTGGGRRYRRLLVSSCSCARKSTSAVFFSSGRPANDGIGAVGFSSVRRIARLRQLVADRRSGAGPGPSLPFSPILWQARQPDWATTSLPASYFWRDLHVDLVRRAGDGAEVGQVAHRARS